MQDEMTAIDGRAPDEGRAGAVLHRVRNRRPARRCVRSRRLGGIVDDLADHSRTLRVRCGSATTRSTARGSSRRIAARAAWSRCRRRRSRARRRLRRDPAADLADDRRRLQARRQRVREEEGGVSESRGARDAIADFSREKPIETVQPVRRHRRPAASGSIGSRQLSASFASAPGLDTSEVCCRDARHDVLPEQRRLQISHAGRIAHTFGVPEAQAERRLHGPISSR